MIPFTRSDRAWTAVGMFLVSWLVFYNIGEQSKVDPSHDFTLAYAYGYLLISLGISLFIYNIATYAGWLRPLD